MFRPCYDVQQSPRLTIDSRRRLRVLAQHEVQHLYRAPLSSDASRKLPLVVHLLERVLVTGQHQLQNLNSVSGSHRVAEQAGMVREVAATVILVLGGRRVGLQQLRHGPNPIWECRKDFTAVAHGIIHHLHAAVGLQQAAELRTI